MTNEEIVLKIHDGIAVKKNMQMLYENNLPMIRKIVKPYSNYVDIDDLLQESYFALGDAVRHYDSNENVLFMTYAAYWIKQYAQRYVDKYAYSVKIPCWLREKIIRYKKNINELTQEYGRTPTRNEIAEKMNISLSEIQDIELYSQDIYSLDATLSEDSENTLSDTIASEFELECEVIDNIYDKYIKNELWGVLGHYLTKKEMCILQDFYLLGKTKKSIAAEQRVSVTRINQIINRALNKLRKEKQTLSEKFDIIDSGIYHNGLQKFVENGYSSNVEYIAIKKLEIYKKYGFAL